MHPVPKAPLTSCEITYFPIDAKNYLEDIDKVLEIIKSYPVTVEIGILSTTIQGSSKEIFGLLQEIYHTMDEENCNFTISVMLSNICGCDP
ncbi:YkoF family thiamine/hydroxymethylpyrimidine-binding protein [Isachenkonia alkalipeptolytica]|uniref:Thiamin/hydroxymethyl pyrimidine-binding YkoF putative domain-containing protein n=1 Tax=Isachenkonia alkalipeptolytica TaxID=2565777 RepID=A0AA43XL46_9CLOT|nr:YkoF family thiamine/hydroxymethylpyrimidine-binding protein [Isachenkonia alkalipeptolytica]NBG88825.1 hypothetical protein [Isachenkonia alkalipeptolytica]